MGDHYIHIGSFAIFIPREALQLFLAALFGLAVGLERAYRGKVASLRTFSMISTGSCLFTILSVTADGSGLENRDATRIAAQVVSGVGFIGGGVIFKQLERVEGITSAAMIWLTAALGMACGFNQIRLVLWAALVFSFIFGSSITLHRIVARYRLRRRRASSVAEGVQSPL